MTAESPSRVLVVANRTASTPALLAEIERRAKAGATFALLIPPEGHDQTSDWTREDALRLVGRAAHAPVESIDSGTDAVDTIHRAIADEKFDSVILSTVSKHHARWLHHDLPHRLQHLGVPVTVIPPEPGKWGPIEGFPPEWTHPESPAGMAGFGNY